MTTEELDAKLEELDRQMEQTSDDNKWVKLFLEWLEYHGQRFGGDKDVT
jgi:hypothetical protein